MSSSSLTAGMLAGLTGKRDDPPPSASSETSSNSTSSSTASTASTTSTASMNTEDVTAEVRFASINWDREKRTRHVDPRRTVDVPLTAQDRFRAIPWDLSQQAPPKAVQTEDDLAGAEERAQALSVKGFFANARW